MDALSEADTTAPPLPAAPLLGAAAALLALGLVGACAGVCLLLDDLSERCDGWAAGADGAAAASLLGFFFLGSGAATASAAAGDF
jgi:hypothetical protein